MRDLPTTAPDTTKELHQSPVILPTQPSVNRFTIPLVPSTAPIKEIIKEVVANTVQTLDQNTSRALSVPAEGVKKAINLDRQLESTVNDFIYNAIFRLRVEYLKIFR